MGYTTTFYGQVAVWVEKCRNRHPDSQSWNQPAPWNALNILSNPCFPNVTIPLATGKLINLAFIIRIF